MSVNINHVVMTGRLTADPELRSTPGGTSVCTLRIAVSESFKNSATGEWEERPNYFTIVVWGAQGENAAKYLAKGRPVAIDGRLSWREWQAQDGTKRQTVEVVARVVQFLGGREGGAGGGEDSQGYTRSAPSSQGGQSSAADVPVDAGSGDFASIPPTGQDDDIPF